jgi:hypothetical protein
MKTQMHAPRRVVSLASISVLALSIAVGCGGGTKESVTAKTPASVSAEQIDADPVALLPGSPVAAVHVNARALLGTSYGEALGRLVDRLVPVGEESGFLPSRDIDALWAASYGGQGVDGMAVLRGKFDEARLKDAADKRASTRGGVVVKSSYAERDVYTVSNVGIVVLTPKTAIVGGETALRRALDRIRDGRLQRSVPSWMLDTMATAGAAFAGAADFETQPIPPEVRAQVPVAWLRNVKTAKVIGTPDSGMRVNGHLTFASADEARGAEAGLRQAETLAKVLSLTGAVPKPENTEVKTDGNSVDCSFRVDEKGLVGAVGSAQRWLGL